MRIPTFIQQLLPVISKTSMLEDLRFARAQYVQLPELLAQTDKTLGNRFKSPEMKHVQQAFTGVVKNNNKGIFGFLAANTKNIIDTIDTVEAIIAGEFEDKIASRGLSYKKASLVQLVDAIVFSSRYTVKLMTFALKKEIEFVRAEKKLDVSDTTQIQPYVLDWFNKGLVPYCVLLNIVTRPISNTVDRLDQIPDILATDTNYATLRNTVGEVKIDPFLFGTHAFLWGAVRNVRMYAVEAKVARAREAEAELAMTKLRILQYERNSQGKEDPSVEREINYLQALADELTRELAKLNEE